MIKCDLNRFMESVNDRAVKGHCHFYEATYVNAYSSYLGYGGPEEGGWWFTVEEPLNGIRVRNKAQALAAYELLYEFHADEFDDDLPTHSVIHEGDFHIWLEEAEADWKPETRPHYE